MASAAPTPLFAYLRPYTFAWYASYERTAWVSVPIFALILAFPIGLAGMWLRRTSGGVRVLITIGAAVFALTIAYQGIGPTIDQLRAGPATNQTPGPGSDAVYRAAGADLSSGEMILTPFHDGAMYGYAFAGLPVSNGPTGQGGIDNPELAAVLADPASVCVDPQLDRALNAQRVSGMILGDRGTAWAGIIRTAATVTAIRGWRVTAQGGGLFYLNRDYSRC